MNDAMLFWHKAAELLCWLRNNIFGWTAPLKKAFNRPGEDFEPEAHNVNVFVFRQSEGGTLSWNKTVMGGKGGRKERELPVAEETTNHTVDPPTAPPQAA